MTKPVSTFSIVAADLTHGDFGVAVASKFLAVGAVVPWAAADAGAVATQSYADASFGPRGLALMRAGESAATVLARLLEDDDDPDRRQVGIVDGSGLAAAHTGAGCHAWAGHAVGPGFAAQGNLLAGPDVVAAMAAAFEVAIGPLAKRLLTVLMAGDAAGGDRRGRQSAALYVARRDGGYLGRNDVLVDLRVDDDPDPIAELSRLLALNDLYFGSSPPEEKLALAGALLAEMKSLLRHAGYFAGALNAEWNSEVEAAFDRFVGTQNLEERIDLGRRTIDPPALDYIRRLLGSSGSPVMGQPG
jgi:uncharacterized Ntn-hydrolase superfamily protein